MGQSNTTDAGGSAHCGRGDLLPPMTVSNAGAIAPRVDDPDAALADHPLARPARLGRPPARPRRALPGRRPGHRGGDRRRPRRARPALRPRLDLPQPRDARGDRSRAPRAPRPRPGPLRPGCTRVPRVRGVRDDRQRPAQRARRRARRGAQSVRLRGELRPLPDRRTVRLVRPSAALLFATAALALSACASEPGGADDGRLQVATTVAPITSIVANIVGDRADVDRGSSRRARTRTRSSRSRASPSCSRRSTSSTSTACVLEDPTRDLAEANLNDGAEIVELGTETIPATRYIYDFSFPTKDGKPNPHLWTDPPLAPRYAEHRRATTWPSATRRTPTTTPPTTRRSPPDRRARPAPCARRSRRSAADRDC